MSDSSTPAAEHADDEISHPLFAKLYDVLPQSILFEPHREYLARDLSGRILELGCGTGDMFPSVAEHATASLEYHAIEPDPYMRKRARKRAGKTGLAVDLRGARAESLPYPDDFFDVVIASLVFCTIQDPDVALEEALRVLEPGGQFRFLEHVHADGWRGSGQQFLNPLWARTAGGCQLTRETIPRFVSHEAVTVEEINRLDLGFFPVAPFVRGTLRRKRGSTLE